MKVCIDIQSTITQRAGVGRYTRQLVQNLGATRRDNDSFVLFYFDFKREGIPAKSPGAEMHPVRFCPGRLARLAWKHFDWPPFNFFAPKADLYHFPNFILPPLRGGRAVVTIHDMSFLRFPQFAERKNQEYLSSRIHDTAARADALITDSNFSGREICELLKVPSGKVFPIHLGISDEFRPQDPDRTRSALAGLGISRPYLLTVGTVEPRKNIEFLVTVFEKLRGFDGELVIAGMQGWDCGPIMKRIAESSRKGDIRYIEYVDDSRLPMLYTGAQLFVCASFYEGFGFPPLEAMACGTPVLSSGGGSLAEVLGNGAVIVHEFDPDAWKVQAEKLLSDTALRNRMIEEGKKTSAKYTWAETARKTWGVYRKVLDGGV
jgi:glycosyltransferase involved in cell wall biosynthesis